MKILPVVAQWFYTDGQTDRHLPKLIVAFRNFVNTPTNRRFSVFLQSDLGGRIVQSV
jgi:hypothetical protein